MRNSIRNIFTTNIYLFFLWYNIYRSRRGLPIKWFNDNTDLFFDGYPRSGNTFMAHLLRGIYDDKNMIHHFHTVAALKIALRKKIKSIIIIRNPSDSISSNYLKKFETRGMPKEVNMQLLKMLLNDYLVYYKYVQKHLNKLHIVEFTNLIKEPENSILNIDSYLDNYSCVKNKSTLENLIRERKLVQFGAKSKLGSSLPSKHKEELKANIKKELMSLCNFIDAKNVFNYITNSSNIN